MRKKPPPQVDDEAQPDKPLEPSEVQDVQELLDRIAELHDRVDDLERQAAEARDGMLRAIADLQNYRRRAIQEAQQARENAAAAIAERLLPVLDNFERTLGAAEAGASAEAILDGVKLTDRQLRAVLEEYQVKPILATGAEFDPAFHDAVTTAHSEHKEGVVLDELERGYTIGKRVLRPAKVRVSKGPPQ